MPDIAWTSATQPNSPSCCSSSATGSPPTPPRSNTASLNRFIGHPSYGRDELRHDLDRFTFLLGGNDGEPLFQPRPRY
jgi:hypothetical protein